MTYAEYMAELAAIKAKKLSPHATFEAHILLTMRNYFTSLPIPEALKMLVDYHGIGPVRNALAGDARRIRRKAK